MSETYKTKMNSFQVIIALAVLVLVISIFTVGIYRLEWNNTLTQSFLKVVPLPAAVVDGKLISVAVVNDRLKAFQNAVSYQTEFEFNTGTGEETLTTQRNQILHSLIEDQLIKGLAEERGIKINDDELNSYYLYLLPQFRILQEEAADKIRDVFGWSEREFQQKIVRPDLLRAKLLISLLEVNTDSEAYEKIKDAQEDLDRGVSFVATARKYSDDEATQFLGGELGFFSRFELPLWFQDSVFPLNEDERSGIIVSPDGYHIFQVMFRDEQIEPTQVQIRHVLVEDDPLTVLLESKKSTAKVYIQK